MNERCAAPEPYAAWTTVCFRAVGTGGASPADGSGGRASFVVWRSEAVCGSALVRSDPLSSSTGWQGSPPSCPHAPGGPLRCDAHLRVDADGPERTGLGEHADVLVSRIPLPSGSAHRRVRELLADHPGCLVAVSGTAMTCVTGVRGRRGAVSFVRPAREGCAAPVPSHTVGSVVHAWVVSGRPLRALRSVSPMPRC